MPFGVSFGAGTWGRCVPFGVSFGVGTWGVCVPFGLSFGVSFGFSFPPCLQDSSPQSYRPPGLPAGLQTYLDFIVYTQRCGIY